MLQILMIFDDEKMDGLCDGETENSNVSSTVNLPMARYHRKAVPKVAPKLKMPRARITNFCL